MSCGCASDCCAAPLGYLGAISATPVEATEANSVIAEYTGTLETLIPWRSAFRVSPDGFRDPQGNTGTVQYDESAMLIVFTDKKTAAVRAAWDMLAWYAAQHGAAGWGGLPTDGYTIVNALPSLRAAISATRAYVLADFDEKNQAESDRIAAARRPDSDAAYRFPTQTITSKPPGLPVGTIAMGAAGLGLAWWLLAGGKKRR